MIRQANTMLDARDSIKLLQEFLKETAYSKAPVAMNNIEHLGKLVFTVMNNGYIWLAYIDNKPVGLLMAIKEPNIWAPTLKDFRELMWFVLPEYRKSTIGGRLFKTFNLKADELLAEGLVDMCFTTTMSTTDSINLERRGYKVTEQVYMKEKR